MLRAGEAFVLVGAGLCYTVVSGLMVLSIIELALTWRSTRGLYTILAHILRVLLLDLTSVSGVA